MNSSLDLLHLAAEAAYRAGEYIGTVGGWDGRTAGDTSSPPTVQPSYRPTTWESKGHHDWVTEVDRHAELLIREVLLRGAPGSTVVGEELNPGARSEERRVGKECRSRWSP